MKTRKGQRRRQTAKPKAHIDQEQNKERPTPKANSPKERRRQTNKRKQKRRTEKTPMRLPGKTKTKNLKPEKNLATPTKKP
jgi:hypothetical protein